MSCCRRKAAARSPVVGCRSGRREEGIVASGSRCWCRCQGSVGCTERVDCAGVRPTGTAATGACPGSCQCAEEELWNTNVPPKPSCEWLNNFAELRRQWSDHARRQNCKCRNSRPCRTTVRCRPYLPRTPCCSTTSLSPSDCQDCCIRYRLSGGANNYPEESFESVTTSDTPVKREAGGGCDSPDCFSSSSSSSSRCRSARGCVTTPRCVPKKSGCCETTLEYCMCRPAGRNCNCPPPMQVDAKAEKGCTCECPSTPECICPPSERRLARPAVRCQNAKLCCPTPRPVPGCRYAACQSCLPCDPCGSANYKNPPINVRSCPPGPPRCVPCARCPPEPKTCRPIPPCNLCRKVRETCPEPCPWSTEVRNCPASRSSTRCKGTGVCATIVRTSSRSSQTQGNGWRSGNAWCGLFSYVRTIGHSVLVPGHLALLSFVLLALLALGLSSLVALRHRYTPVRRMCVKYFGR